MSDETKHYIITINGTQKFLIASCKDDFDTQMWWWIQGLGYEEGIRIRGDELRKKSIAEEKFETTGKSAIIFLKNATTVSWERAVSVDGAWVVA